MEQKKAKKIELLILHFLTPLQDVLTYPNSF